MTDESVPVTTNAAESPVEIETGSRGRFLSALRDSGVRRFSAGTITWGTGHQMVTASQGYLLFEITDSTLWLAALGAAVGFPNVIAAVLGGILSDRFQRKYLLMFGSATVALPMLAIGLLYSLDALQPWHILVAGAAQGVSLALDWTSRLSLLPTLVQRRFMVSALSIDQSLFNSARVIGPLVAGFVLSTAGPSASYGIIAGLFGCAILVYTTFRPVHKEQGHQHGGVFAELVEAFKLLWSEPVLGLNVLFTAINALMLGGFVYLIPAFAKEVFATGEAGLGFIFAATGTGAICGAMFVAWRGGMDSAGKGMLASNLLSALSAVLYAFTGNVWAGASVAFTLGLFNAVHVSLGISAIQVNVPDEVRGRVTGVYELAWASFPLGGLVLGSLASGVGLRWAVIIVAGAVATITVVVFSRSARMRSLRLNP